MNKIQEFAIAYKISTSKEAGGVFDTVVDAVNKLVSKKPEPAVTEPAVYWLNAEIAKTKIPHILNMREDLGKMRKDLGKVIEVCVKKLKAVLKPEETGVLYEEIAELNTFYHQLKDLEESEKAKFESEMAKFESDPNSKVVKELLGQKL